MLRRVAFFMKIWQLGDYQSGCEFFNEFSTQMVVAYLLTIEVTTLFFCKMLCVLFHRQVLYSPVWGRSCNVSNVYNMSAKNISDSEYYGRDLVTWCNVSNVSNICNMSAKNNSDSEYYGRDTISEKAINIKLQWQHNFICL